MRREGFLALLGGLVGAAATGGLPRALERLPVTPAATTIGYSGYAQVGDILRVTSTGEAMRVTALKDGMMTVQRGIGAKAPRPIPSGADYIVVGSAMRAGAEIQ